jgi:hypothetical protein
MVKIKIFIMIEVTDGSTVRKFYGWTEAMILPQVRWVLAP